MARSESTPLLSAGHTSEDGEHSIGGINLGIHSDPTVPSSKGYGTNQSTLVDVNNSSNNLGGPPDPNGPHLHYPQQKGMWKRESTTLPVSIALSWKNIDVRVKVQTKKGSCFRGGVTTEKSILNGVTGIAKPGTLLAIMGASGAGKTTLLNVLTARNIKELDVTGHIYVNGFEVGRGIKNVSAYVQQDDLFLGTLTVREQLKFRALLRMDRRLTTDERLQRVDEVISEMGLNSCVNSRIGEVFGSSRGISGGERKRLSFASEALTNPPLLLCDEPTSGLDTFMAQSIVTTLQKMASKGHTILCTIHQPSSELFAMFNQILIMSQGKTAFGGSPSDALEFFSNMGAPCPNNFNPADHYILTLAIRPGDEEEAKKKSRAICDAFSSSPRASQISQDVNLQIDSALSTTNDPLLKEVASGDSRYVASWWTQFQYLFWRSWVTQFRNLILFRIRFVQSFTIALVFGLIYLQLTISQKGVMDINGAIFVLIISTSFSNMFAVINSFPMELGVFLREYGSGLYRTDVYFITKTISEIPVFFAISVIFVTVAYLMIGLYPHMTAFLWAQLIYFLTACIGISLGYFISAAAGSVTTALAIAPPILTPLMMFGGLFINNNNIPVYFIWLKYLSWFRYANEILMVNQWKHVDHIPCHNSTLPDDVTTTLSPMGKKCQFYSGDDVLDYTSFHKDNVSMDIVALCALLGGLRILAFIALLIRAKRSRE